jgi:hypothetical protein
MVNQFELISFSDDFGMLTGDKGEVGRETEMAGGVPADGDGRAIKTRLFPTEGHRAFDMEKLDNDHRRLFAHRLL